MTPETFTALCDRDLIAEARRLAANERTATATLIACLAELDTRRLHLGMGYSSLHDYCAKVLHLTDFAGYARIEAARVARRFPLVLDLLRDGSINLTTISLLGRHLTVENHGGPTTVDNLQLRCRAHNAYEAELAFGSFVLREEEVGYLAHSTRSGPS